MIQNNGCIFLLVFIKGKPTEYIYDHNNIRGSHEWYTTRDIDFCLFGVTRDTDLARHEMVHLYTVLICHAQKDNYFMLCTTNGCLCILGNFDI